MKKILTIILVPLITLFLLLICYIFYFYIMGLIAEKTNCNTDSVCKINQNCGIVKKVGLCEPPMPCISFQKCVEFSCSDDEIVVECGGKNYQLYENGKPMYVEKIMKSGYKDETGHFCLKKDKLDYKNKENIRLYGIPCKTSKNK